MNTGGLASEKTLLDEFAGQAMLAITISALSENTRTGYNIGNPRFLECLSIDAYAHAEAMLAEKARREATDKDSLTVPDHSPDATKMIELQAANKELVEALDSLEVWGDELNANVNPPSRNCSCHINPPCNDCVDFTGQREAKRGWEDAKTKARAILSKHKGVA